MGLEAEGLLLDGRYRLGGQIGAGSMSVVHEAQDLRLSRRVAIKFLRDNPSDELTERLFREAKAAARADHPAIVTVFGYGTDADNGLHYLVMERLQGEDLVSRLGRQGPLAASVALRLCAEVADALEHVHRTGVVHRDLKPANIFLAQRGLRVDEVKLLDFGVARQFDLHTLTARGELVGTLAYMAPEQISDPHRVGPASDIYALGVVLHECLTGRLPYPARSLSDVAYRAASTMSPNIDVEASGVSAPVARLIAHCLHPDPRQRIGSARALCRALLDL